MTGYLDPSAPSIPSEYARYIDGDLLGKIIARNVLITRLGYSPESVFTPIGRYGDANTKYADSTKVAYDLGDGHIQLGPARITFEIKCARINIANRSRGETTAENWAFINVAHSPGKAPKKYDILIAIGVAVLGLEDHRYWKHMADTCNQLRLAGYPSRLDALPHEEAFLSLCSFFVIPRVSLPGNYFRLNVKTVGRSNYAKYHFWGYDHERAKLIWANAVAVANTAQPPVGGAL